MSEVQVKPGGWVLFRDNGYRPLAVSIKQAERVTPKLVKLAGDFHPRQCSRLQVVAAFSDRTIADGVRNSIAGVSGEFEKRRRAAEDERSRRVTEALTAANEQVRRIIEGGA